MEFGIRELIQFATLLASLAGAFAVVKSQVSRIIQDLTQLQNYVSKLENRLEVIESGQAVIKHQVGVFSNILAPAKLEQNYKAIAELQTEMRVVHKNLDKIYSMHNGSHPPVGAK